MGSNGFRGGEDEFSVLTLTGCDFIFVSYLRRALTDCDAAWGWAMRVLLRCPLAVASELGMCLHTILDVNLGNWLSPDKKPLRTACKKVLGGGLPKQA